MTIEAALADERPDVQVSLWLQNKVWVPGGVEIPSEVMTAHWVDHYLMEVNMGGHLTYFQNWFEEIHPTITSLGAVELDNVRQALAGAVHIVFGAEGPTDREMGDSLCAAVSSDEGRSNLIDQLDDAVMRSSKSVEDATHQYVRRRIAIFKQLDG